MLEREMGLEPTLSIEKQRHGVFVILVLAIEDSQFSF
jgi:hypothetical protein